MRTREEIEKDGTVKADLMLEVLLDIREQLKKASKKPRIKKLK